MTPAAAESFVESLSMIGGRNVFNPWAQRCHQDVDDEAPLQRQKRLVEHLSVSNARLLVLCDHYGQFTSPVTGIPFVSEYLLANDLVPRVKQTVERISTSPQISHDINLTEIWQPLIRAQQIRETIFWALMPLIPLREGCNPNAQIIQRAPEPYELTDHLDRLDTLVHWHPDVTIVCMTAKCHELVMKLREVHPGRYSDRRILSFPNPSRGGAGVLGPMFTELFQVQAA